MFMTPRGLAIRIETQLGFSLMARLFEKDPRTDAFRVLKTVEGLEHIPSVTAFIGAIAGLFYGSGWWYVAIGLVAGKLVGKLATVFRLTFIPGLVPFSVMLSWISGYGLLTITGIVLAWFLRGWEYSAAWVLGSVLAYLVSDWFLEIFVMKYHIRKLGLPFSQVEANFLNAYLMHANRLGVSPSIGVSEGEIESGRWKQCFADYAEKYPRAVERFASTQL